MEEITTQNITRQLNTVVYKVVDDISLLKDKLESLSSSIKGQNNQSTQTDSEILDRISNNLYYVVKQDSIKPLIVEADLSKLSPYTQWTHEKELLEIKKQLEKTQKAIANTGINEKVINYLELESKNIVKNQISKPLGKLITQINNIILKEADSLKSQQPYEDLKTARDKLYKGEFDIKSLKKNLDQISTISQGKENYEKIKLLIDNTQNEADILENTVSKSGIRDINKKVSQYQALSGNNNQQSSTITPSTSNITTTNNKRIVQGAGIIALVAALASILPSDDNNIAINHLTDNKEQSTQEQTQNSTHNQLNQLPHVNHQDNNTIILADKNTPVISPESFVFKDAPFLPNGRTEIHIPDTNNLPDNLTITTPAYKVVGNKTPKTDVRLYINEALLKDYNLTANSLPNYDGDTTMNTVLHFSPKKDDKKPFSVTLVGQGKGTDGEFKLNASKHDRYGVSHIAIMNYKTGDVIREIDVEKFPTAERLSLALENLQLQAERLPSTGSVDFTAQANAFLQNRFATISDSNQAKSR